MLVKIRLRKKRNLKDSENNLFENINEIVMYNFNFMYYLYELSCMLVNIKGKGIVRFLSMITMDPWSNAVIFDMLSNTFQLMKSCVLKIKEGA